MGEFDQYKLEKSLIALWLVDLRFHTRHLVDEYMDDEELLEWAKENIKQRVYENNKFLFEVWYKDQELLYTADEMKYHCMIREESNLRRN